MSQIIRLGFTFKLLSSSSTGKFIMRDSNRDRRQPRAGVTALYPMIIQAVSYTIISHPMTRITEPLIYHGITAWHTTALSVSPDSAWQ
jgi:hypothetical protein